MTRAAPLALVGLLWAGVGAAQVGTQDCFTRARSFHETDRPGEPDGPAVVPAGYVQLEGGLRVSRETGDDDPDVDSYTSPELLVRLGLFKRAELRISADGFVYQDRGGASNRARGSDLEVGAKIQFNCQDGLLPAFGTIVRVSFPTGSVGVTSDGFDPTVELLVDYDVGKRSVLTANLDFSAPTQGVDDDYRVFALEPQASLDVELVEEWGLGTYVEYSGKIQTGGESDEHSLGGGFTWLALRFLQLDVGATGGVNSGAPEWTITAGIAWRFRAWGEPY